MSIEEFEGAGLLIGGLLQRGEFPDIIADQVVKADFSTGKFAAHILWMVKRGYSFETSTGEQLNSVKEIINCKDKIYCKNALDRKFIKLF
jgi:hypothetical protein